MQLSGIFKGVEKPLNHQVIADISGAIEIETQE